MVTPEPIIAEGLLMPGYDATRNRREGGPFDRHCQG